MVYGWSQTRVENRNSWQLETETLDRIFLLCFLSCRVSLLGLLEFLLGCCPTAMSLQINLCANLPIFNQALKCCTSHRFHRYILKLSSQVLYVFMTVSRSLPWTWGLNESSRCISCNIEGKFLMLHPPALGMEEEGDLCKRHIRWTPFREKHFKVFSLPTVKNMGLEPGERQAVLSPLLCPSGKQDLGCAPAGLTKGTWCNLGQSPGLNFPEWVSSCKYLSFLGSWPAAAWEEKGKLLGTLSVNTQWHQNLALEVSWSPPVLSTQDFS